MLLEFITSGGPTFLWHSSRKIHPRISIYSIFLSEIIRIWFVGMTCYFITWLWNWPSTLIVESNFQSKRPSLPIFLTRLELSENFQIFFIKYSWYQSLSEYFLINFSVIILVWGFFWKTPLWLLSAPMRVSSNRSSLPIF